MPKFTITDYAKRVKVSRAYIYKIESQGKIDFTIKGKKKFVDSDQADPIVKYKAAHRATKKTYQKNGAKRKGKSSAGKSSETELPELNKKNSLEDLERIKAYEQARKARIDSDFKEGNYYKISDINEKSFDLFRQIRDGVQSLKDRVALKCRAADSDHESRQILNDEIHNILNSIVDGYDQDDKTVKKKILSLLI